MTLTKRTQEYIRQHLDEDVHTLALRGCRDAEVDLPFALQQIQGRQKAKEKLPSLYANPEILFPVTVSMEQCSSETTAGYKAQIVNGSSFADLSGGFGADTLALAKVFEQGYYVEPNEELCALFEHNIQALDIRNIQIRQGRMEDVLPTLPDMDFLYLDPSRRDAHGNRVVTLEECTPNILEHKEILLKKSRCGILLKLSPMLDLKATLNQLHETTDVHVLAVGGECKELLLLLSHHKPEIVRYHAVNLTPGKVETFTFTDHEEKAAQPTIAPTLRNYLLEPNAAVMKAGAFKSVAVRYGLEKLHPHTHLYTCEVLPVGFPGRVFTIKDAFPYHKKEAAQHLRDIHKANIAVRNFPLTAEALRQQLKLSDGGDIYIFGASLSANNTHTIIVCEKTTHN